MNLHFKPFVLCYHACEHEIISLKLWIEILKKKVFEGLDPPFSILDSQKFQRLKIEIQVKTSC